MRLLIDTHVFIAMAKRTIGSEHPHLIGVLETATVFMSVASIWEIAIKTRLSKLDAGMPPEDIPQACESGGIGIIAINERHVLRSLDPEPDTKDPFDRLLLAQCKVDSLKLVTWDRALADHPLAFRSGR
jgi:PIN domain nuclease of toxin-antitoxin system